MCGRRRWKGAVALHTVCDGQAILCRSRGTHTHSWFPSVRQQAGIEDGQLRGKSSGLVTHTGLAWTAPKSLSHQHGFPSYTVETSVQVQRIQKKNVNFTSHNLHLHYIFLSTGQPNHWFSSVQYFSIYHLTELKKITLNGERWKARLHCLGSRGEKTRTKRDNRIKESILID